MIDDNGGYVNPKTHDIAGAAPNIERVGSGLSVLSADQRLVVCVTALAAFARYTELMAFELSASVIPVTDQDIRDFRRLKIWWNGLGEDKQHLIIRWKDELWGEIEKVTSELM